METPRTRLAATADFWGKVTQIFTVSLTDHTPTPGEEPPIGVGRTERWNEVGQFWRGSTGLFAMWRARADSQGWILGGFGGQTQGFSAPNYSSPTLHAL